LGIFARRGGSLDTLVHPYTYTGETCVTAEFEA